MGSGIFFPLSAIPFSILIMVLFFRKEQAKNIETKIYKFLIICNFIGLLIELLCTYASMIYDTQPLISDIIYKSYLVYLLTWTAFFTYYVYRISTENIPNVTGTMKKVLILFCVLVSAFVYILPIEVVIKNDFQIRYTTGASVFYTYAVSGILVFIMSLILLRNRKNIRKKKYIPVVVFFVVGTLAIVLQLARPELLLITYVETLICVIMYFTIENPDIKMLNELYRNRELMEQGYEDKYNFLFELTQEAKKPILDLNKVCNEMRVEDDLPPKIKDGIMTINNLTRQLDFSVNEVLNISSFDVQKLKIVDTKYDVLKVCSGLETTINNELKDGVKFNMTLPKQVPILYGDYMKLRQILYSMLNNACKNTDNGSVNLKLNVIEKYDFCRLIFNISDTGKGIPIETINDILSATGELDRKEVEMLEKKEFNFKVCQKVVKIMGGNLMIKSTIDKGTDITLTLDQRVYHEDNSSILNQYENIVNTNGKVLIVAQDKKIAGFIKKKLSDKNMSYSLLAYGGDAVDRIKAGKKYNYILIEDEMKEMSGFMTLQELNKLNDFNIPTIIMLKKDKENIKEHFVNDGFSDYLLLDNLDNELNRIMEKY